MTEDLKDKYARLLREGRTDEATAVARKARYGDEENQEKEADDEVESEPVQEEDAGYSSFEELNGVGPELAVELEEEFGSMENLADAAVEDLEPIPGIGETRAKSLLDQL